MHKSPICLLQSPLANASNIYYEKKSAKPYKAPSAVSVASSCSNTQSPESIIHKLQSDIECWQFRYESLERKYTAIISSELDVERREKQLRDDKTQIINSLKQLEEQQESIDNLENEVETLKNQLSYCQQQIEINQSTIKQKEDEIIRLTNQKDMNLNVNVQQKSNIDYQHRDKLNQITIKQQQEEIQELMKKLYKFNENKENNNENHKYQELAAAKQMTEKSLKLKEQEFDALKVLFHEKELDLKEGILRLQKLNAYVQQLQEEKQLLLEKLDEREKNFAQFKHDVESEVDLRLKHLKLEKEALQEQLNQKLVQIQRLSQLQPTLEHYQREFVKAQLNEEALQQQLTVAQNELGAARQQIQMTESLLLAKTQNYEVQIKQLETENCELSQTGRRIEEQYKEQLRTLNSEIKDLETEAQRSKQECSNWKTKFISINKEYHLKQEEAILLQTELHVQKKAIRDCKLMSS